MTCHVLDNDHSPVTCRIDTDAEGPVLILEQDGDRIHLDADYAAELIESIRSLTTQEG